MDTALAGLARYSTILRMRGTTQVEAVATAAVRDARNGGAFLDEVRKLGLAPRLISGTEEAETSAMGVIAAFPGARGVVADLGGGSMELVDIDGMRCEHGVTMPLGSLQLPALRATGPDKFARRVKKALASAHWSGGEGMPLYLVGGSHRALAHYAMQQAAWPLDDPHGYEMSCDETVKLCRSIAHGKPLTAVKGVSASRLAALPDTAALLAVLLRLLQPSHLVFSSWGLREGLIFRGLSSAAQEQDPLLAGTAAFIQTLDVVPATAAVVAGWTAAANPLDGEGHERLRLAATMLALASHRVEPNLRPELAVDWALRKRWIGIDAEGRARIAAALLANTGRLALPPELERLAPAASLREGQAWGLAIRLCRRFSHGLTEALANSSLAIERDQLLLTVREPLDALCNEGVDKDLALLADRLRLQPCLLRVGADDPIGLSEPNAFPASA
jgi:exopolyphosphatase/guanosine-5'-triphosphate,3'-diphosphate pyrophosphatase